MDNTSNHNTPFSITYSQHTQHKEQVFIKNIKGNSPLKTIYSPNYAPKPDNYNSIKNNKNIPYNTHNPTSHANPKHSYPYSTSYITPPSGTTYNGSTTHNAEALSSKQYNTSTAEISSTSTIEIYSYKIATQTMDSQIPQNPNGATSKSYQILALSHGLQKQFSAENLQTNSNNSSITNLKKTIWQLKSESSSPT